nr:protein aar2 like [Quercus suber]
MEKALDEQMKSSKFLTSLDYSQSRRCYYTSIPHVIKQKGIHGQELISLNIDKTQLLESLLIKDYGGSEDVLLGELQFAFIAFLMGQSLEGFLQWKALVNLLFGCIEAPFRTRTQLFTKFIKLFAPSLRGTSLRLLIHCLNDLFSLMLDASSVDGHLLLWVVAVIYPGLAFKFVTRKLKELLENNLGWEFQLNNAVDGIYFAEDDEFAPVVEMLDDPSCN